MSDPAADDGDLMLRELWRVAIRKKNALLVGGGRARALSEGGRGRQLGGIG